MTTNVHHPRSHHVHEDGLTYIREDHEHIRGLFSKFRLGWLALA